MLDLIVPVGLLDPHGGIGGNQPRLVYLSVHIAVALAVNGDPVSGQHIKAVVHRKVASPPVWYLDGVYHMDIVTPLGKILACKHIPVAIQPCPAHILRQRLQHPYIFWVLIHQDRVVIHLCGYKLVVIGVFRCRVVTVYKQALDPRMADSAGVACQVHPMRKIVGATVTGHKAVIHILRKLRSLIDKNYVVLLPLILQHIGLCGAVSKTDPTAVWEYHGLFRVPIGCYIGFQHLSQLQHMVLPQISICPAQDQYLDAAIINGKHGGLCSHHPALTAASGTAVTHPALFRQQKLLLLGIRCA